MARGRFSPWPSYVDLFSAFAVVALAAAWMFSMPTEARVRVLEARNADLQGQLGRLEERLSGPELLGRQLLQRAEKMNLPVEVRKCGEQSVCLDFRPEFPRNQDTLSETDVALVRRIAAGLKEFLESGTLEETGQATTRAIPIRDHTQVVIEGHSDDTQVQAESPSERFRFNWNLSARRASAVLYELDEAGVEQGKFKVVAWGRADSEPVCEPRSTETCRAMNRRTTIRLRFDYEGYDRQKQSGSHP